MTRDMGMQDEQFVTVDGIRTRYFEAGSGEPLLLLHGGNFGDNDNVDCADNWALNWDHFTRSFRVLAIDKLGQGWTDNPAANNYRIEAVVAHAAGFIRTMGIDRLHLVGHSRGGYLAMRLTREAPNRVRTLTIVDSASAAPGENQQRGRLLADAPRPLLSRESLRWVTRAFSFSDAPITDAWLDARVKIGASIKYQEAVQRRAALHDQVFNPGFIAQKAETHAWIRAGNLQVPTLLVWGKNDPSALLSGGIEAYYLMAGSAPRADLHVFNQAGHYSYREHPAEFAAVVTTFIHGRAA